MPAQARPPALYILAAVALLAATIAALLAAHTAEAKQGPQRATGKVLVSRAVAAGRRQPDRRASHPQKRSPKTAPSSGSGTSSSGPTTGGTTTPFAPPARPAPATIPTPTPPPAPAPVPSAPTTPPRPVRPTSGTVLESSFESGNLLNWNIAGLGEVLPTVTNTLARSGSDSARFLLTGNQNRSELIFGGNGTASTYGTEEFFEGEEFWYGFSFYIKQMVYGQPGAHNLIMQFKSNGTGSPNFGLQLWNVNGKKGLWTGGAAQQIGSSGERFLSPLTENAWHDVQIHFKASEVGAGFYETFLDGKLVDAQSGISMIVPGKNGAYIKNGLYRNGGTAPGTSEIFIDSAKLGTTQASVLP
jgi:hypothetical protein